MLMRSLKPKYTTHLMAFPLTDIGALIEALYGIENGTTRGLLFDSSLSDNKGKHPSRPYTPEEVGAISSFLLRRLPKSQHVSIW